MNTNESDKIIKSLNIWQKFTIYWDFRVTKICVDVINKRQTNYYEQSFEEFCNGKYDNHYMSIVGWYMKFNHRINIDKWK